MEYFCMQQIYNKLTVLTRSQHLWWHRLAHSNSFWLFFHLEISKNYISCTNFQLLNGMFSLIRCLPQVLAVIHFFLPLSLEKCEDFLAFGVCRSDNVNGRSSYSGNFFNHRLLILALEQSCAFSSWKSSCFDSFRDNGKFLPPIYHQGWTRASSVYSEK